MVSIRISPDYTWQQGNPYICGDFLEWAQDWHDLKEFVREYHQAYVGDGLDDYTLAQALEELDLSITDIEMVSSGGDPLTLEGLQWAMTEKWERHGDDYVSWEFA